MNETPGALTLRQSVGTLINRYLSRPVSVARSLATPLEATLQCAEGLGGRSKDTGLPGLQCPPSRCRGQDHRERMNRYTWGQFHCRSSRRQARCGCNRLMGLHSGYTFPAYPSAFGRPRPTCKAAGNLWRAGSLYSRTDAKRLPTALNCSVYAITKMQCYTP